MKRTHVRKALSDRERDLLLEIRGRDLLVAFLLSARSSRRFYAIARERAKARYNDSRALQRLAKRGLILRRSNNQLALSDKGSKALELVVARTKDKSRNETWDKKWRLVMYDIPLVHNASRFDLRSILIRAGFRKLQHSVWIYPYECDELVQFLKQHPEIGKHVLSLAVDPWKGLPTIAAWNKLPLALR